MDMSNLAPIKDIKAQRQQINSIKYIIGPKKHKQINVKVKSIYSQLLHIPITLSMSSQQFPTTFSESL